MKIHKTDIIIIVGRRGYGKSYLAKKIIIKDNYDVNFWVYQTIIDHNTGLQNISGTYNLYKYIENGGNGNINYIPETRTAAELWCFLDVVLSAGGGMVVVDEFDYFMSFNQDRINDFLARSRHTRSGMIAIGHRPVACISTLQRSLVNKVIAFNTILPEDKKYLESFGFDREKLSALKKREYLMMEF